MEVGCTVELSFNSTEVLVGSWLFLHTKLSMCKFLVNAWSPCECLNKELSISVHEGQTHFGMSRGTKMIQYKIFSVQTLLIDSKHARKLSKHGSLVCITTNS